MDTENKIAAAMAEEIKNEIDNEIMIGLLDQALVSRQGWTKINMLPSNIEASAWILSNATGNYKYFSGHWYFENSADATAFILKFK